ncbi:hypothetical protein C8F01DRAFT_1137812 [Mycena amicta]|nr:hypothetical protein C8F01DRAFT_1137812 [Mycena amicta]
MTELSPLVLPELLDLCLWHIHTSRSDLAQCTLVARSWLYPAQAHLFRLLHFPLKGGESPSAAWSSRIQALSASPNLLLHVRRVRITAAPGWRTSLEDRLAEIYAVFRLSTNLEAITFTYLGNGRGGLNIPALRTLKQLISIPTLQAVSLTIMFPGDSAFVQLWTDCSPAIRHLTLVSPVKAGSTPSTENHVHSDSGGPGPRIVLDSLSTVSVQNRQLKLLPFDIFRVKTLLVSQLNASATHQLQTNFRNLQELHFGLPGPDRFQSLNPVTLSASSSPDDAPLLDIAVLPRLRILGMSFPVMRKTIQLAIKILATIPSQSVLATIQITPQWTPSNFRGSPEDIAESDELDQQLANMSIEVCVNPRPGTWHLWQSALKRVNETKMLRQAEEKCNCCNSLWVRS